MVMFEGGCFVYGGSTDQQKGDRMPFITIWSADHLQIVIFIISLYHLSIPQILIVIIGWGRKFVLMHFFHHIHLHWLPSLSSSPFEDHDYDHDPHLDHDPHHHPADRQ